MTENQSSRKGVVVHVSNPGRERFIDHLSMAPEVKPFIWEDRSVDELSFDNKETLRLLPSFAAAKHWRDNIPNISKTIDMMVKAEDDHRAWKHIVYGDVVGASLKYPPPKEIKLHDYQSAGIGIKTGGYKPNEMVIFSGRRIGKTYLQHLSRNNQTDRGIDIVLGRETTHASYYATDGHNWREQRPDCTLHMEPRQLRDSAGRLRFYKPSRKGI